MGCLGPSFWAVWEAIFGLSGTLFLGCLGPYFWAVWDAIFGLSGDLILGCLGSSEISYKFPNSGIGQSLLATHAGFWEKSIVPAGYPHEF